MTQEQIEMTRVIAEYDGWEYHDKSNTYHPDGYWTLAEIWAGQWDIENMAYLTEIGWLHPVAMKVMDGLEQRDCHVGTNEYMLIHRIEKACSLKPVNGQYIDLFTAVYNGIEFLNQQIAKP